MDSIMLREKSVFGKFLRFGGMDFDDYRNTVCMVVKCSLWAICKALLMVALVVFLLKVAQDTITDLWYFCSLQRDMSEIRPVAGIIILLVSMVGMGLCLFLTVGLAVLLVYGLYRLLKAICLRWLKPILRPIRKKLCVRIVFSRS